MRGSIVIIATLSLGLLISSYVAIHERKKSEELSGLVLLTAYRENDMERRAVSELAKINGESEASIRRQRIPVLVELKDKDCVSLELKRGFLGSSEAICFQKGSDRILETYSSGE